MAISAKEIVYSVKGMSVRPEFYSGRGATRCDLNGDKLYAIYKKIAQELGTGQADAFVNMIRNLETLSATNFLNALYTLEQNDWKLTDFNESNIDVGSDRTKRSINALSTVSGSLCCFIDDTEYIRLSFLKKIGFEIGPRERERTHCNYHDCYEL